MSFDKNKILGKAQKFIQQGKLQKAIEEYQKIIDTDPTDVRTQLKIGDLNAKLGNIEAASDTYRKVAEHYAKDGFFLKAIAVFKQILKLDPGVINVYMRLAELYNQLGLNSEAMKQYQIVVKHYENKGMKKESLDVLQKMADLDPDNVASKVKLAELYAREGYQDQAVQQFDTVAKELKEKNNYEDLIKVLEKMTGMDPKDFENMKELSTVYLKVGEPKKALAKLQICFKSDPKDPLTLELLAQAFTDLQQPEKAKSVYRELITTYEQNGMIEEKNQIIEKMKSSFPDESFQVSMSSSMSASSAASGKESQLLVSEDEEASAGPDSPEKIISEVDVYLKYGLFDKALENLVKGLGSLDDKDKLIEKFELIKEKEAANDGFKKSLEGLVKRLKDEGKDDIVALLEGAQKEEAPAEAVADPKQEVEEVEVAEEILLSDDGEVVEEGLEVVSDQKPQESDARAAEKQNKGPQIEFPEDVKPPKQEDSVPESLEKEMLREEGTSDKVELSVFDVKEDDLKQTPEEGDSQAQEISLSQDELKIESSPDLGVEPESKLEPEVEPEVKLESQPEPKQKPAPEPKQEPPAEPEAAPESAETKYSDEMEEADFFIKQGLLEEAKYIYESILEAEPDFAEAKNKLSQIESMLAKDKKSKVSFKQEIEPSSSAEPADLDSGDLFDLGKELSEDIKSFERPAGEPEEPVLTFDEMFSQFKQGVAKSLAKDDHQAHYDIGVAYKEMGLLDDALKEFDIAMEKEDLKINCISMIGLCNIAKGKFSEAIETFKSGISMVKKDSEEALSFKYDLADALIKYGQLDEALQALKEVSAKKPSFRNVVKRIKDVEVKIEKAKGDPSSGVSAKEKDDDGSEEDDGGKNDKISYI